MRTEIEQRPVLSYDGRGINGPDEYRSRVATFATDADARKWGALFAEAPALLKALGDVLAVARLPLDVPNMVLDSAARTFTEARSLLARLTPPQPETDGGA